MVDRAARRQLALLPRRYASGRIDAPQLMEGLPEAGTEDAVVARLRDYAPFLEEDYIGMEQRRWWSNRAVSRHDVARWVLFPKSDEEYLWRDRESVGRRWLWVFLCTSAAFLPWMIVPGMPVWGIICLGLFAGGVATRALAIISDLAASMTDWWSAKRDGRTRALWPFFNAEQYARVSKRHRNRGSKRQRNTAFAPTHP